MSQITHHETLRERLRRIIFGTNTPAGQYFDEALIVVILLSVIAVMLDSVQSLHAQYGVWLYRAEWCFTLIFTVEYLVRLWISDRPLRYARSFFGIVDLVSVLPTYLSLLVPGAHYLLSIRLLRALRIFRVLKLAYYLEESTVMAHALAASRRKLLVFLLAIMLLVVILGTLMFVVEGPENGYTSIPESIYWAIVTLTTVGYGDVSPKTPLGQAIASLVMILGYAIIAVPTGIVTVELARSKVKQNVNIACPRCMLEGHAQDARYCRRCGERLLEHDKQVFGE